MKGRWRRINRWCVHYHSPKGCERGHGCTFAHSEEDFEQVYNKEHYEELLETRKMVLCKFFAEGYRCRRDCQFAHGQLELGKPKTGFRNPDFRVHCDALGRGPIPRGGPAEWQIPKSAPGAWRATKGGDDDRWRWRPPCKTDDQPSSSSHEQREPEFQECVNQWQQKQKEQLQMPPLGLRTPRQPDHPPPSWVIRDRRDKILAMYDKLRAEAVAEALGPAAPQQQPQPSTYEALKREARASMNHRSSPYVMTPRPKSVDRFLYGAGCGIKTEEPQAQ